MTETAVQAAATAARTLGLTVTHPTVLHSAFSVVVHLEPSPVVARVPMNLPEYFTDVEVHAEAPCQQRPPSASLIAWGIDQPDQLSVARRSTASSPFPAPGEGSL